MFGYLFVCNMLIPISMIGLGYAFYKYPPKTIDKSFGYRTTMSMKNADTWETAHRYAGRIWFFSGSVLIIASVIWLLLIRDRKDFEDVSLYLTGTQLIVMISALPFVEWRLHKLFDRSGKRK